MLKRGIALTPVKFGISFNLTQFNQAGALVHVYIDGSVLVNHSATEMGQGVNTKVRQVVAQELGVPLERVRSTATDTDKVANTSATAASTGSDMNGKAAQAAARRIRDRLAVVAADRLGGAARRTSSSPTGAVRVNGALDDRSPRSPSAAYAARIAAVVGRLLRDPRPALGRRDDAGPPVLLLLLRRRRERGRRSTR